MLRYILYIVIFLLFAALVIRSADLIAILSNIRPFELMSMYVIAFIPLVVIITIALETLYPKKPTFFLIIIAVLILQCVPLPYDEAYAPFSSEVKPKAIGFGFPFSVVKYYLGESCLGEYSSSCVTPSNRAEQIESNPARGFYTVEEAQEVAKSLRSRAIFPGTIQFTGGNILGVIIWGPQLLFVYLIVRIINRIWTPKKTHKKPLLS